ncbi:hypothetical protein K503DRAFT_268521 [Rhizopogon vinicolor AM-OR11-026]|uniref:Ribonucleases P/MRP subunit Pop8-like domain-containing protein n=1 Tax=Rhizopogon vinicolor AM-OR11-026 TaxID=1314800 RepID=A0A1B7MWD9_9AGAM|nr:hypothetical protein K503DRAFT_268521 [Rhizopogon vinicolor AM-OR11-026]
MTRHLFAKKYSYIHFSIKPPCTDALKIRKTVQDGLEEAFGVTTSGTYLDILWIAEGGSNVIIRVATKDASKFLAAVVTTTMSPRLSMIKETCFLPSLLLSKETST